MLSGTSPNRIAPGYFPPATSIAALSGTKAATICRLLPLLMAKLRVYIPNVYEIARVVARRRENPSSVTQNVTSAHDPSAPM